MMSSNGFDILVDRVYMRRAASQRGILFQNINYRKDQHRRHDDINFNSPVGPVAVLFHRLVYIGNENLIVSIETSGKPF